MASLYQRFSGKINTSRSFPVPPEASHLLGAQCSEEDGSAGKTPRPLQQEGSRPRFQYQPRSDCEEEDVSAKSLAFGSVRFRVSPSGVCVYPFRFADVSSLSNRSLCFSSSPEEVLGMERDGARAERGSPSLCCPVPSLLARSGVGGHEVSTFENSESGFQPSPSQRADTFLSFFFFFFSPRRSHSLKCFAEFQR